MRVTLCVDALEPQLAGIGRYTWELCQGLKKSPEIAQLNFYGRNRLIDDPALLRRGGSLPRRKALPRLLGRMAAKRALRSTLVHGPNFFLPKDAETGIVTVHDLSVLRYPETHPIERVRAFEQLFTASLERAAHIITDTETVREEVIEAFSVSAENVTAVPLGVDERFRPLPSEHLPAGVGRWGLRAGAYGLTVSTLEPRKKIAELIRAWRRVEPALRDRFPLVIAGGGGWRNDEIQGEIRAGENEGWLRYLGFVDDELLPELYAGAALFAYPSIYEGFGLPPIEAMASGVPVLVSGRSCLPEVCGDAARYVDPDDEAGLARTIGVALSDTEWRSQAARSGLERAARFKWDRCIDDTVAVYRKVSMAL